MGFKISNTILEGLSKINSSLLGGQKVAEKANEKVKEKIDTEDEMQYLALEDSDKNDDVVEVKYMKENEKIKTDANNTPYVTVEPWQKNSKNDYSCMWNIVGNCYDLDAIIADYGIADKDEARNILMNAIAGANGMASCEQVIHDGQQLNLVLPTQALFESISSDFNVKVDSEAFVVDRTLKVGDDSKGDDGINDDEKQDDAITTGDPIKDSYATLEGADKNKQMIALAQLLQNKNTGEDETALLTQLLSQTENADKFGDGFDGKEITDSIKFGDWSYEIKNYNDFHDELYNVLQKARNGDITSQEAMEHLQHYYNDVGEILTDMKRFYNESNKNKKSGDEGYDSSKLGGNDEVTLLPVLISILNGQDPSTLDGDENAAKHTDFSALAKKEDLQEFARTVNDKDVFYNLIWNKSNSVKDENGKSTKDVKLPDVGDVKLADEEYMKDGQVSVQQIFDTISKLDVSLPKNRKKAYALLCQLGSTAQDVLNQADKIDGFYMNQELKLQIFDLLWNNSLDGSFNDIKKDSGGDIHKLEREEWVNITE